MIKKIQKLAILAFFSLPTVVGSAQSSAANGSVEFQKGNKQAAVLNLPYSSDVAAKAIKDYFFKLGVKEDKIKGFQVFKNVRLSPSDQEAVDLYFKTDKKSRKESNASIVYMIVGQPNENLATRTQDFSYKGDEGREFLTKMSSSLDSYNLEVGISAQTEVLTKAEKKLRSLREDQADLEKKIKNLEEKLVQNKRDQDAQTTEVTRQRSALESMQGRRSSAN